MDKLLTKNPARIARPGTQAKQVPGTVSEGAEPFPDRFPDETAQGTPPDLAQELEALLGKEQVLTDVIDLVRYASDASHYRLRPQVVVCPRTIEDVAKLARYCNANGRHLTFRAGGSSLNGQALSDDILVDLRKHFRGMVLGDRQITVAPGEVLQNVLAVLGRRGEKIGPDPASASIATIGGILSNNSGGMRCRVDMDSYHSIIDLKMVLASGTVVDTADPAADAKLAEAEPQIAQGLMDIREEILQDQELVERIRQKFTIRNTNGLRLDAFLDGTTPVEILRHLLIGAEGILGMIAESTIRTLPKPKMAAVSWVLLPSLDLAAGYVDKLVRVGAESVELLVSPVLHEAVGNFPGADPAWTELPNEVAALLLEVAGQDEAELERKMAAAREALSTANLVAPLRFTRDLKQIDQAWEIRAGMVPLVGKLRPQGSSLITEACATRRSASARPPRTSWTCWPSTTTRSW